MDYIFIVGVLISLFVAGWCLGNKLDKDRFIELELGINSLLRELKHTKLNNERKDIFYKTKEGDIINLNEIERINFHKSSDGHIVYYTITFKGNDERGMLLEKEEYNSMIEYLDCINLGTWVFSNSGKTKVKVGE